MNDYKELSRVLADLDGDTESYHDVPGVIVRAQRKTSADAARVIREMAADFQKHAIHGVHSTGRGGGCPKDTQPFIYECECGLDAARAKWRLE